MNRWFVLMIALFVIPLLLGAEAPANTAQIKLEVKNDYETNEIVIRAKVTSSLSILTVKASFNDTEKDLVYRPSIQQWELWSSLAVLKPGIQPIVIKATDASGNTHTYTGSYTVPTHTVQLKSPVAHQFFNKSVTADVYTQPEVGLFLEDHYGVNQPGEPYRILPIATGGSYIREEIPLRSERVDTSLYDKEVFRPWNQSPVNLIFQAMHQYKSGPLGRRDVPVYVDTSHRLQILHSVPGKILDYDQSRVLYITNKKQLYLKYLTTGETKHVAEMRYITTATLTPKGCIYKVADSGVRAPAYEWTEAGTTQKLSYIPEIKGGYALYKQDGLYKLRNLTTSKVEWTIRGDAVVQFFYYGKVVYWLDNYFYSFQNGQTTRLFEQAGVFNFIATSTNKIVYTVKNAQTLEYELYHSDYYYRKKKLGAMGNYEVPKPHTDYEYNENWIAYKLPSPGFSYSLPRNLHVINSEGQSKQITFHKEEVDTVIEGVNYYGDIIFSDKTGSSYIASYTRPTPVLISKSASIIKFMNDKIYSAIGNSIMEVNQIPDSTLLSHEYKNHVFTLTYSGPVKQGSGSQGIQVRMERTGEQLKFKAVWGGNALRIELLEPMLGDAEIVVPHHATSDMKGIPASSYDTYWNYDPYGYSGTVLGLSLYDPLYAFSALSNVSVSLYQITPFGEKFIDRKLTTSLGGVHFFVQEKGYYKYRIEKEGYVDMEEEVYIGVGELYKAFNLTRE
ncbi:hypothetical protein [Paenibacillus swuensis]|nr:hypothetical protein [Paenibacillus swuensis]